MDDCQTKALRGRFCAGRVKAACKPAYEATLSSTEQHPQARPADHGKEDLEDLPALAGRSCTLQRKLDKGRLWAGKGSMEGSGYSGTSS